MFNKGNLILLGFSVVFCLYSFELVLYASKTFWYSEHSLASKKRIQAALAQGEDFDTRTHLQFIRDNSLVGRMLSPRVPPKEFNKSNGLKAPNGRLFPLGGVSNSATVYCNNYGEFLLFDSDKWGLRNPALAHQNNPLDALIVGDSFSMGHCVDNDIASLLRLRGMNTVSVAYSGNGPLLELATLREYGSQLSPKVVLWLYYEGNDLWDLGSEMKSSLLMSYLKPGFSQRLSDRQPQVDLLLERYIERKRVKKLKSTNWSAVARLLATRFLLKKSAIKLFGLDKRRMHSGIDLVLFEKILIRAQIDISSWGGQMYFVYLPEWTRFAETGESKNLLRYRSDVLSLVSKLKIPTVDITEVLASAEDPKAYFPYGFRGHYTDEGYAILADQIYKKLNDDDLIPKRLPIQ